MSEVEKSVGTTSPASARVSTARYAKKNKKALSSKWKVANAIKRGDLKKPSHCPRCGRDVPLDFHHSDKGYAAENALRGKFLCRQCHADADPGKKGKQMSASRRKAKPTNT